MKDGNTAWRRQPPTRWTMAEAPESCPDAAIFARRGVTPLARRSVAGRRHPTLGLGRVRPVDDPEAALADTDSGYLVNQITEAVPNAVRTSARRDPYGFR
jgi:hypothetical protein